MILTGKNLTQALLAPIGSVRLIDHTGQLVGKVSASEAMTLIARGNHAVGGTAARVKYLRKHPPAVDPRPFEVSPDFWSGRGVFRWWRDQSSARGRVLA